MYIKSITLDGFKSYGHRTEIQGFDPEFNAITGLNGSGKSNILDSICFVLGITNLSHVRAASLQDLIYKSGQAGVNRASVSVTFDNRNSSQSPSGFEQFEEITITRQVIMGGKNKYMLNGAVVQNKRVQDLFCSVQLNVNNPHFLIMQGKITKVLNMRPPEILAMVEEAAGTRMYETKRQIAQKTLDKKNAKLAELMSILDEDVAPRLTKLREERTQFFEFQRLERELGHMSALYQAWQYCCIQKSYAKAEKALKEGEDKVQGIQDTIKNNKNTIKELEVEVAKMTEEAVQFTSGRLVEIKDNLKEQEKVEAKALSQVKAARENVASEEKKIQQLQKNIKDDEAALKVKEQELSNVEGMFQKLRDNEAADAEAFTLSQRKYEAVSTGMEVNEAGEAETLQEQLMNARRESAQANTDFKDANMQLEHCQAQLKEKRKGLGSDLVEYRKDKAALELTERDAALFKERLKKIDYSEASYNQLQEQKRKLLGEIKQLKNRIDNFEASKPYTTFNYKDPEMNFNRKSVYGVVCKLIKLKDKVHAMAIETAAGGRLYNVVVNTEVTGKKLLQKGNLQHRTTFIPMNKIEGSVIDRNVIARAEKLVGKENIQPALSVLEYNGELKPAMEFIFGNVFICKNINIARQVAFDEKIKKRCVTLDGDVADPAGSLSGGARQKTVPILLQIEDILHYERQLVEKEHELAEVEQKINYLLSSQKQWMDLTEQVELKNQHLEFLRKVLQQNTHHQQQQEVTTLENIIAQLCEKMKTCKNIEDKANEKAKELESKMKDTKGYQEKRLKEAETEMKLLKQKANKSKKEWTQKQQDFETLNLEISELKKSLQNNREQLTNAQQNLLQLKEKHEEHLKAEQEIKKVVTSLQEELKAEKNSAATKNKNIQNKVAEKEKLLANNAELELEIKNAQYEIKKLEDDFKMTKSRTVELTNKCKNDDKNLKDAEQMNEKESQELEKRLRNANEKRQKLSRVINAKAQSMYEQEEKAFTQMQKKMSSVNGDRKKLIATIADLDQKKKEAIQLAHNQVTKDFGSIFGTLLPGSNAKLVVPEGKSILDGLEIKVSLGGVWKESLNELSGGQRSLVALSLILAMLLFKPAPLYILDEVDAALDLSHTQNIGSMLKSHFKQSQFIIVSLKDGMFNNANVLFKTQFINGMSAVTRTINKSNY